MTGGRSELDSYRAAAAALLILAALVALSSLGFGGLSASANNYGYGYGYQYAPTVLLVGDEVIEPAVDQTSAGRAEVFVYTAIRTGTVKEMRLYLDLSNQATKIVLGMYTDTGTNRAGTLLTQGSRTPVVNGTWNTVDVVPDVNVTAGTKYWLAVLSPLGSGTIAIRDHCCAFQSTPPNSVSETSRRSDLTALPTTWVRGTRFPKDGPATLAAYGPDP